MADKMSEEIMHLHKDVEELKEMLEILIDNYVEMMHAAVEKEKDSFISLDKYKKKYGL